MKERIVSRVLQAASIIILEQSNVRDVAKKMGISKSTVHQDLAYRLPLISQSEYIKVRKLFEINKMEKHLRGGEKTKKRYEGKPKVKK